jgi:hypothetical protein
MLPRNPKELKNLKDLKAHFTVDDAEWYEEFDKQTDLALQESLKLRQASEAKSTGGDPGPINVFPSPLEMPQHGDRRLGGRPRLPLPTVHRKFESGWKDVREAHAAPGRRKLTTMESKLHQLITQVDGEFVVTIPGFVTPGCIEERRRRRRLRGERNKVFKLEFPAGWEPKNIHPNALAQNGAGPWLDKHRRLTNSEVITFAKGTGCTIDIASFPVKLECTIVLNFHYGDLLGGGGGSLGGAVNDGDKFTLTPVASVTVGFAGDGEELEIQFGFGIDTSEVPAQGAEIPGALVDFGNFMRENKIDVGAMLNSIFKDAMQFPSTGHGFHLNFPADPEKKSHQLFAYSLGKLFHEEGAEESLRAKPFCFTVSGF